MANDESNGQTREQLPDLYRLLGLTPLESDITKIQRSLVEMQRKVDAAQKTDVKLAQRAAKIIALAKKNLLEADRKLSYDRAWTSAFGAARTALPKGVEKVAQPTVEANEPELEWDLEELESYLPAEDPRSPFDLGGFLRYSANLPELNPIADYNKLQGFLGGTATATIAAPESISAARLMPDLMPEHEQQYSRADREPAEVSESYPSSKPPGVAQRVPQRDFAKQIRRKRNRAMLLSIGGIVGSFALVAGAYAFWASSTKSPVQQPNQLAQATVASDKTKPLVPKDTNTVPVPAEVQGSGLPKVMGLDGSTPTSMKAETEKPAENPVTMQPAPPMQAEPAPATTPEPVTPATTPAEPSPPAPEPTAAPATEPVLTDAERSKWSKAMKELLKTLGNQDFVTAKKQLAESETLARTQLQKDQHKRVATVAQLAEEYHGFLVDAIRGLEAAEPITIGSMEASFIEGNEKAILLKIRGRIQTFKLTELQVGVANAIVDRKMDIAHPSSLARKAAFALVHPKTNDIAIKRAREQMAEAVGSRAVEADMSAVFDENYSLREK